MTGSLLCGECAAPAVRRTNRFGGQFFGCTRYPACTAMVACHADGRPMGVPAGKETRAMRRRVHVAFDPLWASGQMSRADAYRWLKQATGIGHIGEATKLECTIMLTAIEARRSGAGFDGAYSTALEDIARWLATNGVRVHLHAFDLPYCGGLFRSETREVFLNVESAREALITLAHEAGHWIGYLREGFEENDRKHTYQRERQAFVFGWRVLQWFDLADVLVSRAEWIEDHRSGRDLSDVSTETFRRAV